VGAGGGVTGGVVGGVGTGGLRGAGDGRFTLGRFCGGGTVRLGVTRTTGFGWTTTAGGTIFFALTVRGAAAARVRVCRLGCCGATRTGGAITTGGEDACEGGGCGKPDTVGAGWRKLPSVKVRATNPTAQAAAKARNTSTEYPFAARQLQAPRNTKAALRRPSYGNSSAGLRVTA
jgi:hypothetical protein